MGKREKEHRKKVQKRNQKIKHAQEKFKKEYRAMLEQKLAEFQEKYSASTQNETLNANDVTNTLTDGAI
jgi:hypothetical protein